MSSVAQPNAFHHWILRNPIAGTWIRINKIINIYHSYGYFFSCTYVRVSVFVNLHELLTVVAEDDDDDIRDNKFARHPGQQIFCYTFSATLWDCNGFVWFFAPNWNYSGVKSIREWWHDSSSLHSYRKSFQCVYTIVLCLLSIAWHRNPIYAAMYIVYVLVISFQWIPNKKPTTKLSSSMVSSFTVSSFSHRFAFKRSAAFCTFKWAVEPNEFGYSFNQAQLKRKDFPVYPSVMEFMNVHIMAAVVIAWATTTAAAITTRVTIHHNHLTISPHTWSSVGIEGAMVVIYIIDKPSNVLDTDWTNKFGSRKIIKRPWMAYIIHRNVKMYTYNVHTRLQAPRYTYIVVAIGRIHVSPK